MAKPIHRIFCIGANKTKLGFDTEPEALLYIERNSKEIRKERGEAPFRAYKCEFCGKWHVTSKLTHANQRERDLLPKSNSLATPFASMAGKLLKRVLRNNFELDEAVERLEDCQEVLELAKQVILEDKIILEKLYCRVNRVLNYLKEHEEFPEERIRKSFLRSYFKIQEENPGLFYWDPEAPYTIFDLTPENIREVEICNHHSSQS